MTLPEGNSFEESSRAGPNAHFSTPVSATSESSSLSTSEEWEYEYSTTETETYYLTLDLTTPSIPCARPKIPRSGPGGWRSTWINPGRRRPKRNLGAAPTISLPGKDTGASSSVKAPILPPLSPTLGSDDDGGEDMIYGDEDFQEQPDSVQGSPDKDNGSTRIQDSKVVDMPERIQILDLHTENPIIAYKAHNFSCSWAENIGTELLFTFRDPERPLPSLRSLDDNVELLAASSARLISKSVKLTSNGTTVGEDGEEIFKRHARNPTTTNSNPVSISIPVGPGASNSRKDQARFLERMMEIKQSKGEEDSVTVVAHRRLHPSGWKTVLREKRTEERVALRLLVIKGGSDAEKAARRLKEMDDEDRLAEEEKEKKNGPLKTATVAREPVDEDALRPAKRARGAALFRRPRGGRARTNLFNGSRQDGTLPTRDGNSEGGELSTPTPRRWDE